jgi:(1->4)-alpha-D-glucan 1-alpha-D-glucosylmutase
VKRTRGDPGLLDAVLQRQFYLLHGWKLAGELGNYRRFFDVGALGGIRTGAARGVRGRACAHRTMLVRGEIDGLRVDHPDGLREPLEYFKRLRAAAAGAHLRREDPGERRAPEGGLAHRRHVGYEFLAKVNRCGWTISAPTR